MQAFFVSSDIVSAPAAISADHKVNQQLARALSIVSQNAALKSIDRKTVAHELNVHNGVLPTCDSQCRVNMHILDNPFCENAVVKPYWKK